MVATPKTPIRPTGRDAGAGADPADEVYIHLSDQDRDIVLKTIEAESQPNETLRSVAERFKKRYG